VAGYAFSNWDVDGTSQGSGVNPITINTNARHTATAHYQAIPRSASVQTATGTGTATVATDVGYIQGLTAVAEATLPSSGKPGLLFPHGFFSFKVAGLSSGQTAKITIALPLNVPLGSQYWKCQTGVWRQVPIGDDDGDNVITIQLRDGGTYDGDGLANGQIVDPGGLGIRLPAPPDGIVAKYDLDDGVKENDPTWGTVFTAPMYGAVAKSDDIYAVTRVVHTYDYSQQFFRFDVGTAITEFTVTWEGNIAFKEAFLGDPGPHTEGIDIWNNALNTWERVGNVSQVGDFYTVPGAPIGASVQGKLTFMAPEDTVSKTYNTSLNNYVTSGHVYLMVWAKNSHDATISTDYVGFQCKNAPHPPVGGEWVPTSKFRLLAPVISLVLVMTLVTVSFVYVRRKRHQD
jgi:hypothetical protein